MRIIKFRAWNKTDKIMLHNFVLDYHQGKLYSEMPVDGAVGWCYDFWHIELMQFTGFTDKNGKEIYEGDIVKHSYRVKNTVIEWRGIETQWSMGGYANDTVEVIGNIYENPELLIK